MTTWLSGLLLKLTTAKWVLVVTARPQHNTTMTMTLITGPSNKQLKGVDYKQVSMSPVLLSLAPLLLLLLTLLAAVDS